MRERLEAMKAIWTQSKPEYHGEFVDFGPMMTWPKPVQKPHPPVLVGGEIPHGARWVFQHPFFLLLNVAVGGGWPGNPDPTTEFPQTMLVDYVRVYRRRGN